MTQSPLIHFLLSLLFSLIVVGLDFQNKISWASTPISSALTPLRTPLLTTRGYLFDQLEFLKNLPHQERLIEDLLRQNAQLSLQANQTKELKKENESLKSLLSAKVSPNHRVVSAKITSLSRFATINQGSSAGIIRGLPAVIDDNLVGIVTNTSPNSSSIRLLNDLDTKIEAVTITGISGELIFENNTLRLVRIPQKENLSPDTPVFTSGGDGLPDGLLLGHIKHVNNNESSAYQSADINHATEISQYQYIFVLLD